MIKSGESFIPQRRIAETSTAARWINIILKHLLLVFFGLAFLLPFYWMIVSSFRPLSEYYQIPIPLFPASPTLDNYVKLFARAPFMRGMLNSALLAVVSVITQVFFCGLAGYTFAKINFRFREQLFVGILATMMIPGSVTMVPNFIIMSRIHWVDTYWPLIVPGIANAFGIFWMRQYCMSLPSELLDAARVDGASELGIFLRIVIPVIQPALASLSIFVFLSSWTDFQGPLIFLRTDTLYTIQLWLSIVSRQGNMSQPQLIMAGSVLASIPVLILFVTLQKYFVAGLTTGSIK